MHLRQAILIAALLAPAAARAARKAPPVSPAASYPAKDTHDKEHVTVAAEPFETRDKADFFRNDYPGHSVLPIRVIIQNDSDTALDLNQVRMQFIASDGTKLPAATPEELNRRLFRFQDIKAKHIPGTPIVYHPTPVDKKIIDDDKDFSFSQTIIPAHTAASGFLFYDVKEVDGNALEGGQLYVKMIHTKDKDSKENELFGFTVPFDKYLEQQKALKAAQKASDAAKDTLKKDKP